MSVLLRLFLEVKVLPDFLGVFWDVGEIGEYLLRIETWIKTIISHSAYLSQYIRVRAECG